MEKYACLASVLLSISKYSLLVDNCSASTLAINSFNSLIDYLALPAAQRIINTGTGHRQFITAWEMFQTDNGSSFTTQLNLLNTGLMGNYDAQRKMNENGQSVFSVYLGD